MSSDLISARELRQLLYQAGAVSDEEALAWIAWGCQHAGVIASGVSYGWFGKDPNGLDAQRAGPATYARQPVTEPFWRVFERAQLSDQVTVGADWHGGHFWFAFERLDDTDWAYQSKGCRSLMFDQASAMALIRYIGRNGAPTASDDEIAEWICGNVPPHNSKTAFPAFRAQFGAKRAGPKKNFDAIYSRVVGRKRGRPRR